jgi:hypothetical protein
MARGLHWRISIAHACATSSLFGEVVSAPNEAPARRLVGLVSIPLKC